MHVFAWAAFHLHDRRAQIYQAGKLAARHWAIARLETSSQGQLPTVIACLTAHQLLQLLLNPQPDADMVSRIRPDGGGVAAASRHLRFRGLSSYLKVSGAA